MLLVVKTSNNIIPFVKPVNPEYENELLKTVDELENIKEDIKNLMFPLATIGKWKEWSDAQPIDSMFNVTDDMLENTGDKNVELLWEIIYKMNDVIGQLSRKCNHTPIEKDDISNDEIPF